MRRHLGLWKPLLAVALGAIAVLTFATPAGTILSLVGRHAFTSATHAMVGVATAQESGSRREVLKFEPVSAESAAAAERAARRSRTSRVPPVAPAPAVPAVPEPPPAPIVVGRSGDIMRVGSDITIDEDQTVTGDVLAVGASVRVKGHVEGNVASMGGNIYLEPTARVDGDVVTMGGELQEEPGASVGGQRVVGLGRNGRVKVDSEDEEDSGRHDRDNDVGEAFAWLVVWLLIAFLVTKLFPGRTGEAVATFDRDPGAAVLSGLLGVVLAIPGLIAVALVVALLCITIIGIPLAIAALFGYLALIAVLYGWGSIVGAAALGQRVLAGRGAAGSLTRHALTGVLLLDGTGLFAEMLKSTNFGAFDALGGLLGVLAVLANLLLCVIIGPGALMRSELATGFVGRWWSGRRTVARETAAATPPPPPAASPAPPAPLPPSPPSSYAPPSSGDPPPVI
jgi:hypothetical protein